MKRILVVDDDEAILRLLKKTLAMLGFEADCTTQGQQAIELLQKYRYDLILLDIRMPEVNGVEVAAAAHKNAPSIPILFMSGNPNIKLEKRCFLTKPFNITELKTKLDIMFNADASDTIA